MSDMSDTKRYTIQGVIFNDGAFDAADASTRDIPPSEDYVFVLASDYDALEGRFRDAHALLVTRDARIIDLEHAITDALEKLEKPYNEDDRIYPATGILEAALAKKGKP